MTLEEAKRRIEECMKQSTDDYNRYEDEVSRGEADAYKHALEILECIEPVGNPDKLTLKELAHELRRLFRFKYLTVSSTNGWCINVWKYFKPEWSEIDGWIGCYLAFDIYPDELICELDFSEYEDADGNIDYSKCIVEVSDDAE